MRQHLAGGVWIDEFHRWTLPVTKVSCGPQSFPLTGLLMKQQLLICVAALSAASTGYSQSLVANGAQVVKLAGDMKFTEGPVWLPGQKKLVFSDIPNSQLMEWSKGGGLKQYRPSKNANGNIIDFEGRIISCQHSGRNVIRIEKDGSETVLASAHDGHKFNSPNDCVLQSDGSLWFTDPPWGLQGPHDYPGHWVFRRDPETGKSIPVIKDLAMPNGIVFSPDESRIYVADTGGHPRHPDSAFHKLPDAIHCYAVDWHGLPGKKLFVIDQGSDGMAVDMKGNLYTTHGGHVTVFDADGNQLEQIAVPENPANCCFGGPDFKTLFITARTSLYSVRMNNKGFQAKPAEKQK